MLPTYDHKLSPTEVRDRNRGTRESERERKAQLPKLKREGKKS